MSAAFACRLLVRWSGLNGVEPQSAVLLPRCVRTAGLAKTEVIGALLGIGNDTYHFNDMPDQEAGSAKNQKAEL